jgi:hypothetical protein
MSRRNLAAGAAVVVVPVVVVPVVAVVVVGGAFFGPSRTPERQSVIPPAPQITGSSPLTFDAPAATPVPMEVTTTTGAPVVSWKVSGSCVRSGSTFLCKVTVMASNHLQSGGFVDVIPAKGYDPACQLRGELSQDSAIISGTCEGPFASSVLAVYSARVNINPSLAQANLPWSRSTANR